MKLGEHYDADEGVMYSDHLCEACGEEFSIAPCVRDEDAHLYPFCLGPECESYDPNRDADWLMDVFGVRSN